jgi:VPDSG-CTERM motif
LTQLIFLYSNDAGGLLADVGLPAAFYPNSVTVTENENAITTFIPTTGQPGFLPVAPVPITYRIISMPDSGSTLLLLGLALSGLTVARMVTTSAVKNRRYRRGAITRNNFVVAR